MKNNISTPFYALSLDAAGDFQVYINDILIAYYYQKGATTLTIPINREILRSGKQKIRIKLESDKLLESDELEYYKFKILKFDSMDAIDSDVIVDCKFDVEKSKKVKIFSQTWDFISEVPYSLKGWSKSENLLNEDKDELLKEVLFTYNDFRNILKKKDTRLFYLKTQNRDDEINKALYFNNNNIKEDKLQTENTIQSISEVLPMENFKMVFYGEGKMVGLIHIDDKNKDESPIQAKLNDNSIEIFDLILHRPKAGAPLEIIR